MSSICFKNVRVIFGDSPPVVAVDDISMEIHPGEIFVIMGLSGSGKSTLLRCINGLTTPTYGTIKVANRDEELEVTDCTPSQLRRLRRQSVSMVFQRFALLPWRTVAQNIAFGLEIAGIPKEDQNHRVERQLELVGLASWANKPVHQLSGGMQQRVGLARALVTDAEILLMDEPFSALDPLIRSRLQEELLELQERLQKTIVFVSHDLDEAFRLGSRIAIMEAGRIVQCGDAHEIIQAPANNYVGDFIAQMNPLNVLTARSVMRPIQSLPTQADGQILVDEERKFTVQLDKNGKVLEVGDFGKALSNATFAQPQMTLREVIAIRSTSGLPILVRQEEHLIGVIDDQEIFNALSQRDPTIESHLPKDS